MPNIVSLQKDRAFYQAVKICLHELNNNVRSMYRRGVAQPGSAPALGAGSRRFKSSRPDQQNIRL
jgi:hypothetical protein